MLYIITCLCKIMYDICGNDIYCITLLFIYFNITNIYVISVNITNI